MSDEWELAKLQPKHNSNPVNEIVTHTPTQQPHYYGHGGEILIALAHITYAYT